MMMMMVTQIYDPAILGACAQILMPQAARIPSIVNGATGWWSMFQVGMCPREKCVQSTLELVHHKAQGYTDTSFWVSTCTEVITQSLNLSLILFPCMVVYKQPGRVEYSDPKLGLTTSGRASTKASDIATKYNLGSPVAANFCQAEWDDYVPKLYQKLSS